MWSIEGPCGYQLFLKLPPRLSWLCGTVCSSIMAREVESISLGATAEMLKAVVASLGVLGKIANPISNRVCVLGLRLSEVVYES